MQPVCAGGPVRASGSPKRTAQGGPLDATNKYITGFPLGQMPPVPGFWSLSLSMTLGWLAFLTTAAPRIGPSNCLDRLGGTLNPEAKERGE